MCCGPDGSCLPMGLCLVYLYSPTTSSITFAPEYPSFSVAMCCQLDRTQRMLERLWGAGWPSNACTVCLEDQRQQVMGLCQCLLHLGKERTHFCFVFYF